MAASIAANVGRSRRALSIGDVEGVGASPAAVEGERLPFDAVETGSQRFADRGPGLELGFVGAPPHSLVRVGVEVDEGRHGQALHAAIELEIHGKLGGNHRLELVPGPAPAEGQFGSQRLLSRPHEVTRLLGGFTQHEGMGLGRGILGDSCIQGWPEAPTQRSKCTVNCSTRTATCSNSDCFLTAALSRESVVTKLWM